MKDRFHVCVTRSNSEVRTIITGVCCIMPNMNGVLFQTKNRRDYQLEYDECCGSDGITYTIEYDDWKKYEQAIDFEYTLVDGEN